MSQKSMTKSLSDIATLRTEKVLGDKDKSKPYIGLEHIASDEPVLIGTASAASSISTNSVFYRGDILFGKLRPNLRKSLLAPFDGYCSTDILVLKPSPGFDARFVARVFQRTEVFDEAVRTAEGTKMPRTSWNNLRKYWVYVPQTDSERVVIARILDTLDEVIQKTEQLIAKLKAIKQGLLHDLLTRGLDENGQLRDPVAHPEQFKDSPLGRIPKEWEVVSLGSCLSVLYRYPSYYGIKYVDSGVPEVRGELINDDGTLDQNKKNYRMVSEETASKFKKVRLSYNDFVMSVRGTIGKIAIVPQWLSGAVITANLIRIQFIPERVFPHWAFHLLTSNWFQFVLDKTVSATTIKTIQAPKFCSILFARPNTGEQKKISYFLETQDNQIKREEAHLAKLRLLKKGLMHDLLTGKVRVNVQSEEQKNENSHHS